MNERMSAFAWDKNYDNLEQVRPYLADYTTLRDAGFSYNDDFKGKIAGIAGSPNEDAAIYMLSCLWRIEGETEEIAHAINDGYQEVSSSKKHEARYPDVIVYRPNHYVGGTGRIDRYTDARIRFDLQGFPVAVVSKGKRKGVSVKGAKVLAR